jgi:hypothetical protein
MCHFVTAILPASSDVECVRELARKRGFSWEPIENPSVARLLRPGETYYFTTRGMCDCGTSIGSRSRIHFGSIEPDYERERKKLRKMGWSQAKLDRWLADRKSAHAKRLAALDARGDPGESHARRWLDLLQAALTTRTASSIGLLLHFYKGGVETESIPVSKRAFVPLAELSLDRLLDVREDVIYEFGIPPRSGAGM